MELNKVEVVEGVRTLQKMVNGKKYTFEGLKYRKIKELKKTAGDDTMMLNDIIILECVKEPKLSMSDLDGMDMADIIHIEKAVAEVTGVNPKMIEGF